MQGWGEHAQRIALLTQRQLFFVGGAPRSGTTWLQQMLDAHPDISCRGEALFMGSLASPLDELMEKRRKTIEEKNQGIFRHTGGYPLPGSEDSDFLLATAILLGFERQCAGAIPLAIGEKTPENVFFFPRLKKLFPTAKFVGIARDPRDVLTSAWHFFRRPVAQAEEVAAKLAFLRSAFPSIAEGARQMIALAERYPDDSAIVTYEALRQDPAPIVARLFGFLGVSNTEEVVADCIERTRFAALSGGRAAGVEQKGSFFRKGVVGDWQSTLTPEMNEMVMHELGWMFQHFGWKA